MTLIRDNSDISWEKWGKENPYYGVLTDDKFRKEHLTSGLKTDFLETGRIHIDRVLALARSHWGAMGSQASALDFGCGVGRLVVPLAQVFERVTAVDVSPSMLEVAKQNCLDQGIGNVDFIRSDDRLTRVTGKFDFIHSYLSCNTFLFVAVKKLSYNCWID